MSPKHSAIELAAVVVDDVEDSDRPARVLILEIDGLDDGSGLVDLQQRGRPVAEIDVGVEGDRAGRGDDGRGGG